MKIGAIPEGKETWRNNIISYILVGGIRSGGWHEALTEIINYGIKQKFVQTTPRRITYKLI